MGVRYEWVDENKIIVNIYLEFPWTWHEYHEVTHNLMPLIRELEHPCATVVDVTRMGAFPKDGNIIQILLNVDKTMPDNVFASAIAGTSYGVMVFMNLLMKLSPRAKRIAIFTQSIAEAHETIMNQYHRLKSKNP